MVARSCTTVAREAGTVFVREGQTASRLWSVVFDANDRVALARFWAAALGWMYGEDQGYSSITGGDGTLRRLEFVTAPNEKRSANWMHFDLSSTSIDDQRATV